MTYGGQEQLATPAERVVYDPCRKSRRKCDRNSPCDNCTRRAISCTHKSPTVESRARTPHSPLGSLPYILPRAAPPHRLYGSERAPPQHNDKPSPAPDQHMCNGALLLSQPRGICHTINWCRPTTSPGFCAKKPSKGGRTVGAGDLELQIDAKTAVAVLRRASLESANPNGDINVSYATDRASDKQTDNLCARIHEHINLGQLCLALDLTGTVLHCGTDGEVRQHLRNEASLESPTTEDLSDKNDSDDIGHGRSASLGKLHKTLAFFVGDQHLHGGCETSPAPFDHEPEKNKADIDLDEVMQRLTTIDHETEEGVIQLLWLGVQLGNNVSAGDDHDPTTDLEHSARIPRLERELYLNLVLIVVWCRLACAEDRKALNEATVLPRMVKSFSTYRPLADGSIHKHACRVLAAFQQLCELDLAGTAKNGLRVQAALSAALHLAVGQKEGRGGELPVDDILNRFREHLRTLGHVASRQTISAEALVVYDKLCQHPSADIQKARCVTPVSQPSRQLGDESESRKRKLDQLTSQVTPLSMMSQRDIKQPQSKISPSSRNSTSQLLAVNDFTSEPDTSSPSEVPSSVHQYTAEISSSRVTTIAAHDYKAYPPHTQAPMMVRPSVLGTTPADQSSYTMKPGDERPAYAVSQGAHVRCPPAARVQSLNDKNLILSSQTPSTTMRTPPNKAPGIPTWMTTESLTYWQPHIPTDRHLAVTGQMYPTANGQPTASHYWSPYTYASESEMPYQQYSSSFDPALQYYNNQPYLSAWPYFSLNDATPSKSA